MGKLVITGWSAVLRCNSCGQEHESKQYKTWAIDSKTIAFCQTCEKATSHTVVRKIAESLDDVDPVKEHKTATPLSK